MKGYDVTHPTIHRLGSAWLYGQ